MKKLSARFLFLFLLFAVVAAAPVAAQGTKGGKPSPKQAREKQSKKNGTNAAAAMSDDDAKAKLDAALKLPPAEGVAELERFVKANPQSPLRGRATELLTAARAALGDVKLAAGDAEGGVEMFRLAVAESPAEMPDKLFAEVVSQLPANLFLRGQSAAALELARAVEERVRQDPKRLLALAAFYLRVEQPDEAARLAEAAIALAPGQPAAYLALGSAHRLAFRLEQATAAFKHAFELDAKSAEARRNLADLERAAGRSDEALALYRELLASDAKDAGARAGMVLALFDAGKKEEAERELESALKDDERNLSLLVGAAWWYVSHGDAARAQELAVRAVRLEPRYTWAQIALARSLLAQRRPFDAERALRFARQYGRFPTLDYELAATLAAAGLYDEAADELARTFTIKDGQLETRLAGRTPARADSFTELLAPERRASIFQPSAVAEDAGARTLKSLLALHLLLGQTAGVVATSPTRDKNIGAAEAVQFAAGEDEMRAFRQLYAAGRLLQHGVAPEEARRLTDGAMSSVDVALKTPVATAALLAEELRDPRARAIATGNIPDLPDVPANILSNIMRGRIEDIAGWSLFNEGQAAEAVVRLKRATSVLPDGSPWWRTSMWHLGAALDASGSQQEALNAYIRSYNPRSPDPARRAIIENLYRRLNGSLEGLEQKIGAAPAALSVASVTPPTPQPSTTSTPAAVASSTPETLQTASTSPTPLPSPTTATEASTPATTGTTPPTTVTEPTPEPVSTTAPKPEPLSVSATTPTSNTTPANATTPTPTPEIAAASTPAPTPAPTLDATQTPQPTPSPTPDSAPPEGAPAPPAPSVSPTPTPEQKSEPEQNAEAARRSDRSGDAGGSCALVLAEDSRTINQGASAQVTLSFNGANGSPRLDASTPNWSDIIVLAEPRAAGAAANESRYTISSISRKTGTYVITFTSPCGSKKLNVTVK